MIQSKILSWFMFNPLGEAMRTVPWLFPLGQVLHFFGLCFLIGAILIVDLRLLGFLRKLKVEAALALIPVAIWAFVLNVVTGLAFFTSDPGRYWLNPAFKLKMAAVVLAGVNALWFTFVAQRRVLALPQGAPAALGTKITAVLSLTFWFSVILLGRLLPVYQP